MSTVGTSRISLRPEQAELSRLLRAVVLSLAAHLLFWGVYHAGNRYDIWKKIQLPQWMQTQRMLTELLSPPPPKPKPEDMPVMFVDVSAAAAALEAPKNAKYYSDKNAFAANPDADVDTDVPRIEGKQTRVIKTEDVPVTRREAVSLQPAVPAPQVEPAPEVEVPKPVTEPPKPVAEAPKPAVQEAPKLNPGDLALLRPTQTPQAVPRQPAPPQPRPRTIKEALARLPESSIAGEKMKQEGGVSRRFKTSLLDTKATPFGAYDAAIIAAVQSRWFQLLDEREFASDAAGYVTLKFRLHSDGNITQMKLEDSTVDYALALLCQNAIQHPAPYGPWPAEMRKVIGADHRDITFTFYYY